MGTQAPDLPVIPSVMPVGLRGTGQRPVVIDLCCGLGGWSKAFLEEGWDAIGFDIERHEYGNKRYPGHLVLKSILDLNGYDLRHSVNPSLIVASPPCQEFSYMAMPWKRAKQIAAALRGDGTFPEGYTGSRTLEELTALYRACLRIARECGCPIVLENVKGAQPWVGRAQANFGSYYLWGDIANVGGRVVRPDALAFGMPGVKAAGRKQKYNPDGTEHGTGSWFAVADSKNRGASSAGNGSWFAIGSPGQKETGGNPVNAAERLATLTAQRTEENGVKGTGGGWFEKPYRERGDITGQFNSKSPARKAASAMIAEIPYELAAHIARVFKP